jgi:hypothetical protein
MRTSDEIKKKFDDLKTRTKKKANQERVMRNKTGIEPLDGPEVWTTLTDLEQRIMGL